MTEEIQKYFHNRRTVRQFRAEAPSEAMIAEIVEAATKAPNTGNMQLYSVVESRSKEQLSRLAPTHFNQPAAVSAPVLLTVCADVHRFERWCEVSSAEPAMRNLQMLLAAIIDAVALSQQIVTVAELSGLGTCYLGTVTYNAPQIAEILRLPSGVVPVCCLAVGYPAAEGVESERLPVDGILYHETYPALADEEIRRIYSAKDCYEPNRKFVEENGKESLAQVFTDVRYPKRNNEPFSEVFMNFLRAQGFNL